jgi:hypothetical protein
MHLKFISELRVIVLSIVLLTGISLVPALQIGVYGQVQQQQQQQPQQNSVGGLSQIIKQIAQQVATAILLQHGALNVQPISFYIQDTLLHDSIYNNNNK